MLSQRTIVFVVLTLFLPTIVFSGHKHNYDQEEGNSDGTVYKTSFFDDLARRRKGGIDVSKHSKISRKRLQPHSHGPTRSPEIIHTIPEVNVEPPEKPGSDDGGLEKPVLRVGIVFPKAIFHTRTYHSKIRNSMNEIKQEKCLHDVEESERKYRSFSYRYRRSRRTGISLGGSSRSRNRSGLLRTGSANGTKPSIFRSAKDSILSRKKPYQRKTVSEEKNLFEHVRENYEFVYNSATFRLHDNEDSINFGNLDVSPPPSDITDLLCQHLQNGSVAILYFTRTEKFGRSTAASQYFLQMASFLGIPVIAWNADNSGLEKRSASHLGSEMTGHLQLAPSVDHQISAMLSILDRYNWRQFGILTSEIAGHDDFVQAVRDRASELSKKSRSRYVVQNVFKVSESNGWDVSDLAASEVRIIILYCTLVESNSILESAAKFGLTSNKYLWLVTQSVIGDPEDKSANRRAMPVGMLGIHFNVDMNEVLQPFVSLGLRTFFHAVDTMLKKYEDKEPANGGNAAAASGLSKEDFVKMRQRSLFNFSLNCQGVGSNHRWKNGPEFYRELLNTTLTMKRENNKAEQIFNSDGTIRETELKIMNLRPMGNKMATDSAGIAIKKWEEVGIWNSWNGLDIKDIVWPGGSHVPPQGVPEKFHIRITFLEEPPFIIVSDPDPVTNKCSMNRGVPCWMGNKPVGDGHKNETKCCSGLCIDLLTKFEDELGFTYDLVRTPDPKWGTFEQGKWNGLMAELVNKRTDLVLSALKVNAEREAAVDFTIPFLESGIAIVVAKRTGIISPTAFLEPFDKLSWMLIVLVAIQASAFSIFLFEWLSPAGYDMQVVPSKTGHKFSLFRTYWLVWAVLFQAAVSVDCPRGLTARFMSSIWALFAVVFLALYTANLAAFMIPRKEYHNLSGLDDRRIANPHSQKPSLKFSTVPYSYTQVTLQKYFPEMFDYMKRFHEHNQTAEAVKAVKEGKLDAFIYDGTVLSYLASQDDECRLLQVGSWSAMTGYALAFPHHSKFKAMFNDKILELRENGDLERLSRFWMSGTCKPNEQEKRASEPLSIAQFLSAFLLLGIGTALSIVLLCCEHFYMKYLQGHVDRTNRAGCCGLISQAAFADWTSIGQNYTGKEPPPDGEITEITDTTAVAEKVKLKTSDCQCQRADICNARLCNLTAELEAAKEEIDYLETILSLHKKEPSNEGTILDDHEQAHDELVNELEPDEVQDDRTDNDENELGLDEEPLDGIIELDHAGDMLLLTTPRRQVQSHRESSLSEVEEKETVL